MHTLFSLFIVIAFVNTTAAASHGMHSFTVKYDTTCPFEVCLHINTSTSFELNVYANGEKKIYHINPINSINGEHRSIRFEGSIKSIDFVYHDNNSTTITYDVNSLCGSSVIIMIGPAIIMAFLVIFIIVVAYKGQQEFYYKD